MGAIFLYAATALARASAFLHAGRECGKVVLARNRGAAEMSKTAIIPREGRDMATVFIPSLMQKLSDGNGKVRVEGATVRQIVNNLDAQYPGFKERLVEDGRIKGSISVAIDGEITPLGMLEKVGEDSEVHFLPAIGGGA